MKVKESFRNVFRNMTHSVSRYPLTILFLFSFAILNGVMIEQSDENLTRLLYTALVGATLSVVAQTIYERFGRIEMHRYLLLLVTVGLTIGYYFTIGSLPQYGLDIFVKTSVALFALMIAFIWIPSIDNPNISFHRSFLSAVKAFFTALLFVIVLSLGISAIFSAISYLLIQLDFNLLAHVLNPVYSLFAPIFFLSFAPQYQTEDEINQNQLITNQQFIVPRFFEILLSYIIIPLVGIYTLILVIYVLTNITSNFWSDNLLEPLLVSYAVIVIIVMILSYNIENHFTVVFRRVFPKILVPIVIFQTIASILKIQEMGLTHGRYYVILFGIFATLTGLIFSFMKPKHHGYIAAILVILATVSIIPPVDAFTLSKNSQIDLLEETLSENNLLRGETIQPDTNIPEEDKIVITNVLSYLYDMDYVDDLPYLPDNFDLYSDFNKTFGFNLTYSREESENQMNGGQYVYINREESAIFEISGYDVMIRQSFYHNIGDEPQGEEQTAFSVDGEDYSLEWELIDDYYQFTIRDANNEELLTYHIEDLFDEIFGEPVDFQYAETVLDSEEAIFEVGNEDIDVTIMLYSLERIPDYNSAEFDMLIDVK